MANSWPLTRSVSLLVSRCGCIFQREGSKALLLLEAKLVHIFRPEGSLFLDANLFHLCDRNSPTHDWRSK